MWRIQREIIERLQKENADLRSKLWYDEYKKEVENIVANWEWLLRAMKSWEIREYSYNWIDIYGNIIYRPTWISSFIKQI